MVRSDGSGFDYEDDGLWPDDHNYCGDTDYQSPKDIDTNSLHENTCENDSADMLYSIWNLKENDLDITYDIEKSTHGLKLVSQNDNNDIKLTVDGISYCYNGNVHFHWGPNSDQGSEHTIDGSAYPLEAHYIHYKCDLNSVGNALTVWEDDHAADPDYKVLAVVGVFFSISEEDNPAFTKILDSLDANEEAPEAVEINYVTDGLVSDDDVIFYYYQGSTTTPPCVTTVNWIVSKLGSTSISETQLESLRNGITNKNYRSTQNNNKDVYKDTCLPDSGSGSESGGNVTEPTGNNETDTTNGGNSGNNETDTSNGESSGEEEIKSWMNSFCFCANQDQINNVEGGLSVPNGAIVEIKKGGDCELECPADNSGGRRLLNDSDSGSDGDSDELNHYTVTITVEITPENAASYTEEHTVDHFTSMSQEELEAYGNDIINNITNTVVEQIESNCDGCDISPIGEPVIEEAGGETPTEPENPTGGDNSTTPTNGTNAGNETDSSDGGSDSNEGSDSSETGGDSSTTVVIKISRIFCNGDAAPTVTDIDITIQEAGLEDIVIGVTLDGPKEITPVPDECKSTKRRLLSAGLDSDGADEWTIIVKADKSANTDEIEQSFQQSSFCKNSPSGECDIVAVENSKPPAGSPCVDPNEVVEGYRRMYKDILDTCIQEEYGVLTRTGFLTFMFSAGARVTGCSECKDSLNDWSDEANSLFGKSNTVSLPRYLKKNLPSKDYRCAEKYFPESLYLLDD